MIPRTLTYLLLAIAVSIPIAPNTNASPHPSEELADWTILFYGAADNDCEQDLVPDIGNLLPGLPQEEGLEVLFFVDRSAQHSSEHGPFGEDFQGARLYRVEGHSLRRVDGGAELPALSDTGETSVNAGAAETLKGFVRLGKRLLPAKRTALIFYSHGGGYSLCPDEGQGGDELYTAELTDVLTEQEAVDLLVFDVCSMAGVENAYQWRPGNGSFSADVVVGTPNAGMAFPWQRVLRGIRRPGAADHRPECLDPREMDALQFGQLVVESMRSHRSESLEEMPEMAPFVNLEAMACLDLRQAAAVKAAADDLAIALVGSKGVVERIRGSADSSPTMHYVMPDEPHAWLSMPYYDAYDLARRLAQAEDLGEEARTRARALMEAVDALVVSSFGMAHYDGFEPGKHGVYLVFPNGDAESGGKTHWERLSWYSPDDRSELPYSYGRYAWCADASVRGNGQVETWFELLDSWYDAASGDGVNGYAW